MANYVEFFRFSDQYENVFTEGDNHYPHACAEYGNYTGYLVCCEYIALGNGEYLMCEHTCADAAYLESLDPAPADVARDIIIIETREMLAHREDMDADEKSAYMDYTRDRLAYEMEVC